VISAKSAKAKVLLFLWMKLIEFTNFFIALTGLLISIILDRLDNQSLVI
jgi:hypothetical protein